MDSSKKLNFWKRLKIRWKLILIILPTTLIPLILITVISSYRIYGYLDQQNFEYYSAIMEQMGSNMQYVFGQYAMTVSNIFKSPDVKMGLLAPKYKSVKEEIKINRQILGSNLKKGSLKNIVHEKIVGQVYIYEMDKKSLQFPSQNYTVHKVTNNDLVINYNKMIQDDLFKYIIKNKNKNIICGKFSKGVITGNGSSDLFAMIFPYYLNNDRSENFRKFMLVLINKKFLSKFYMKNEDFKRGTLYILDNNNKIVLANHPNDSDIFKFEDDGNRKYVNVKNNAIKISANANNFFYNSFKAYSFLNIDQGILEDATVKKIKALADGYLRSLTKSGQDGGDKATIVNSKYKIKYNKTKYAIICNFEETTQFKFIFFYPQFYVLFPILNIIFIVLIIGILSIIIITFSTIIFSMTMTNPISRLVDATKLLGQGNYSKFVKVKSYDEIGSLSVNFNQMIKNIKAYQDKMLSAEREKSEMELASKIQMSLLPPIPDKQFYDIAATMIPSTEVGGDYYDLITENSGRIWMGIGDVSGHGLSSGLIMMMAQTAFNTILLNEPDITTDKLIVDVNKVLYQNVKQRLDKDDFMTLSFMVADPSGEVKFSGAHLDVLIYREKTKKVERVKTAGVWLGILPDIKRGTLEKSFKLDKGDLMLLYTDGLIEAMDANNNQYDMKRLINKLEEFGEEPVLNIEEAIIRDVFNFLEEQKDDITFVIARKVN